MSDNLNATVVDLFCGVGGMTHGFLRAGLKVVAGVDNDPACKHAYETNNQGARFVEKDLFTFDAIAVDQLFSDNPGRKILIGCAPCQPFSKYSSPKNKREEVEHLDQRWKLVQRFGEIIEHIRPDVVSMENVPNLQSFNSGKIFKSFLRQLQVAGYDDANIVYGTLYGPDYGIPQTRKRLVLLASRLGPISLPDKTHTPNNYPTVKQTIDCLPALRPGQIDSHDTIHRARGLSETNIRRIQHSLPGGTWSDWPEELRLVCHSKTSGKSFDDVYGRMVWEAPAPTLTTQFYNYGTGRFGHPEQDRAISFREGALLQTFPMNYVFDRADKPLTNVALARLIGNAVPVTLAEAIANAIRKHLEKYDVR
jgi:DNA (cytosine-5)-methyltransferase 1